VGGVGDEAALRSEGGLEPGEQPVEGVAEFLELVVRRCRLVSEMSRTAVVMLRSGRSTCPATSQPRPMDTTVMMASAMPDCNSSWYSSAACWCLASRSADAGSMGAAFGAGLP
jgi:hypothetical protein